MAVKRMLLVVAGAGLVLQGCISEQNDRMTIGRSVKLEAFYPPIAGEAPEGVPVLAEQTPSLDGLERGHWQQTYFLVPVDGTAHKPLYVKRLHLADRSHHQRREFPTPTSAMELSEGSEQQQQLEALGNAGLAVTDVVLLAPRLILEPPWRLRWSPVIAYERYWHPPAAAVTGVPSAGTPVEVIAGPDPGAAAPADERPGTPRP